MPGSRYRLRLFNLKNSELRTPTIPQMIQNQIVQPVVHAKPRMGYTATPIVVLFALGIASAWLYFWGRDLHRFTQWIAAYFGLYIVQLAIYALACALIWNRSLKDFVRSNWILSLCVLGFALVFRLTLVWQQPYLSDDVYRYVWDGRVQAAGINPYSYVPEDPQLARLRDADIFAKIPALDRRWITPYPPAAQLAFRAVYLIRPSSVTAFKSASVFSDMLAIAALMFALKRIGDNPARAVVFAWHPLLIFESAHSGHVESMFIAFVTIGLAAWSARAGPVKKSVVAGTAISLATLVKFYPALVLPAFVSGSSDSNSILERIFRTVFNRRSLALVAGFAGAAILFWLPYAGAGSRMFTFVSDYIVGEGFSGSGSRYFGLELLTAVAPVPAVAFLIAGALVILWAAVHIALKTKKDVRDVASGCLALVGLYLLITSPRYAWYYAWLLPFLCFVPSAGWLYLASAGALLYLLWYTPLVYPNVPLWLGCGVYLPAIMLLVFERWSKMRREESPVGESTAKERTGDQVLSSES
ncbi:MAG TPA: glycosyltransferase family 87 protein [Blastocatellia bacterium]|nr:glycosyltransferase family 87 protein [Blastocatellia bacterium]